MRAIAAVLGLAAIGCTSGTTTGPSSDPLSIVSVPTAEEPTPAGPLVVYVRAEGVETYALEVALDELRRAGGDGLRVVRGIGPRQITLTLGTPHTGAATANPYACTCPGEGLILLGSWAAANNENVLLHEFGHLFGLEHSDDPEELMYPSVSYSTRMWRFSAREVALIRKAIAADLDAAGR